MNVHRPEVALTSSIGDMHVWDGWSSGGRVSAGSSRIHPLATCRQLDVLFVIYANKCSDTTSAHVRVKEGTALLSVRLLNLKSTSYYGQQADFGLCIRCCLILTNQLTNAMTDYTVQPNNLAQKITHLTDIREMPGSNLGRHTDYPL
jgi:hypothetical protein